MKIFTVTKYLLVILAIAFLFVDWRIAAGLFLLVTIFHVIPLGPNALLSVITGYLIFGGIGSLFFDWRIGAILIVVGFLVAKFHVWGNKKNHEYYKQKDGLIRGQSKRKQENKDRILEFMRKNEKVANNDIEKLLGVSDATATRYLNELEKEGKIEQHGTIGQNVFYTLK